MTDFRFSEKKGVSLRHQIAEDIRQAILSRKLKPGDRLREVEISKQMGVSRGPLREAIRVLEQEGLLTSQPYKETVVTEFSKEEAIEVLIPIRQIIELFALRKGVPQMREHDLQLLSEIVDKMKVSGEHSDLANLVELDLLFHEYIVKLPQLDNIYNIWSSIYNRIRLHFLYQGQMYENLNDVWKEHLLILEALQSRDLKKILYEMTQHISVSNFEILNHATE